MTLYVLIFVAAFNGRPLTITAEFATASACRTELESISRAKKFETIIYTNCAPKQQ